jgi:hypothetical protein
VDKMVGRRELLNRVLQHYKKRIISIKEDSDIILYGDDILNLDLVRIASEVDQSLAQINNPKIGLTDNIKLLCSAIDCYINDLESVKKRIKTELGSTELKFDNIDQEIIDTQKSKEENCKSNNS